MADVLKITINGKTLPGEVVSLKRSDELLWSEGTGRGATNGLLTGSVVAKKQTWNITWGVITTTQYNNIISYIPAGFLQMRILVNNITTSLITVYRGNISGEFLGAPNGGTSYWKNVTVDLIER